ncbi:MAG: hypothetical protein RR738_06770 [Anaerorhabdus sp.]|uniref:hypothetical protein n=1 Tax=Anaerorhabdus sp. TaxID=1872524 RepID=UPI002FCB014A
MFKRIMNKNDNRIINTPVVVKDEQDLLKLASFDRLNAYFEQNISHIRIAVCDDSNEYINY